MFNRVISLNYTSCITKNVPPPFILLVVPTMYGLPQLFPPTYHLGGNPVDWARPAAKKKMFISHSRKISLTKEQISCNHPIQASFIAALLLLYNFFNFRLHVQIYHANFDYSIVTESYLLHDKSNEWSKFLRKFFQSLSPSFNTFCKTLLQLLLVLHFTPSLFYFKL